MHHIFKVLLAHDGKINSLEELLSSWINSNGLLELAEVWPVGLDHSISLRYQCFLFRYFLNFSIILIFHSLEDLFFICLILMDCHKLLDNI